MVVTSPEPSVSVVIPFFRAGRFLAEAIESVLQQVSFSNWQIVLVNDQSDGCDVAIARCYQARLPDRVLLLEAEGAGQQGPGLSRNLGILSSQSDLIAFLDADDVWFPHKLVMQTSLMTSHPEVDMVYGPALRWWSWNGGIDVYVPPVVDGYGIDCVVPGKALLQTFLRDETLTPCTGSVLVRRSALGATGLFEEKFRGLYDDQVLYAKLCQRSKIYVSSECVSRYRQHRLSCCGQAEVTGLGVSARVRFLEWLRAYEASVPLEIIEPALSSR